jgi:hypothetical protein
MKILNTKNYGSIPHLSNSKLGEKDYFIGEGEERMLTERKLDQDDVVLVFEKYDGSNIGVTKKNGNIYALNRSGYEASTSPYLQHKLFAKWVGRNFELFYNLLDEEERISGEWLAQVHGAFYDIENDPIVFYDWFDRDNNRYHFSKLQDTNLPLARLLHKGDPIKVEELIPKLNLKTSTIKSKDLPEGMVYRVERLNKPTILAKWVRHDFEPGKYMIGKKEHELKWNIDVEHYK